jgi:hypothetical protein
MLRILPFLCALLLIGSCKKDDGQSGPPASTAFDYKVEGSTALTVQRLDTVDVPFSITTLSGAAQTVTVEVQPVATHDKLSASLIQTSGTPPFTSTLRIISSGAAQGSNYLYRLTARGADLAPKVLDITISVVKNQPCRDMLLGTWRRQPINGAPATYLIQITPHPSQPDSFYISNLLNRGANFSPVVAGVTCLDSQSIYVPRNFGPHPQTPNTTTYMEAWGGTFSGDANRFRLIVHTGGVVPEDYFFTRE